MAKVFWMLLLVVLTVGCDGTNVAPETDADLEAAAAGVGKEIQVKYFITEALKLSSVELTPTGGGNFEGKGTDARGTEYEIKIEQQPGAIEYT